MELGKTLYVWSREAWRSWLSENHSKEKEIWLIYPRKRSGEPRIPYNDAVEEALCFGWIDSITKGIDETRFAQRFTPRRPGSALSQMNKERIRVLIEQKKMTDAGFQAITKVYDGVPDHGEAVPPEDVLEVLKGNADAWTNFQGFPESYKRIRLGYIESQRRHGAEAFQRSLSHFVKMTAKNKRIGFVRS